MAKILIKNRTAFTDRLGNPCGADPTEACDQASQWAQYLVANPDYIILDTETTGFHSTDQVIEIGMINSSGNVLLNALMKPTVFIPSEASAVHGIYDKTVENCPAFADCYLAIKRYMEGRNVIIYNSEFDVRLIRQTCMAFGLEPITYKASCAMLNYAKYKGIWDQRFNNWKYPKLPDAKHGTIADCKAVLKVIQEMACGRTDGND